MMILFSIMMFAGITIFTIFAMIAGTGDYGYGRPEWKDKILVGLTWFGAIMAIVGMSLFFYFGFIV
jgi:hypothetical protein